jgi:hypoxanthine phosphoribosyltransferase
MNAGIDALYGGDMSGQSYDYSNRTGVTPVSWEYFHGLCKGLALAVSPFAPQLILPIGRGGYYPGTLLAHMLQVEVYPVRLSRRLNDVVVHASPQWLLEPPHCVQGQRVLIVDEICASGETLLLVKQKVQDLSATAMRSAVLYAHHGGASVPDYIGLVSDDLLLNPWDREVLRDGQFQFHPEYVDALAQQGLAPEPSMRVNAPISLPVKAVD